MECTQDTIVDFLRERGGRVRNTELLEHFKAVFPAEPERRAAARDTFKSYVDGVAFVKTQSGVKYVCLKKKFRASAGSLETGKASTGSNGGTVARRSSSDDAVVPRAPRPGSDYGSVSQVKVPHVFAAPSGKRQEAREGDGSGGEVTEARGETEMGNRGSLKREERESKKGESKPPDVPRIAVIEASPLPAEGSVFNLPGPVTTGLSVSNPLLEVEGLSGPHKAPGHQKPEGQQEDGGGTLEGPWDTHSLSGSEGNGSPKGSRKHFIEVMMNSSPEVRHSMVLRNWVPFPMRGDDASDSASVGSSAPEDDRASVALDPVEHEWMMCASDGEWASLQRLLADEPSLVLRKDFVTGFTCLHWAAKHGRPELIALIINFAKQHHVPISVDVRSSTGYTPLHIAAMHNHMEVVKLLVGAYNADVEARDYSGKKACQYLTDNVSVDIRDIIGAYECSESSEDPRHKDGGRWRFSKVLQSNLRPLKLLDPNDLDSSDGEGRPRVPPLRRKSSLGRMGPKLQRLRARTSQIIHSTTFHGPDDLGASVRSSFRARPKTHFFG